MDDQLISIIVPCYNQAQYLDECLQSVLDQTYQDWECIIVNDGSPDKTEEVTKKWIEKDIRFKYNYKENGGLSSARNAGIEIARGEWILPLDSDDKIAKNYLELATNKFADNPLIIYCNAEYFGDRNGIINLEEYSFARILKKNMIFCTAFFRKSDWKKAGGYDEKLKFGLEDWDFWISLLKNNNENAVYKIPKVCFFYRIKEKSMLTTLLQKNIDEVREYILVKHHKIYNETFGNMLQLLEENRNLKNKENYYQKSKPHRIAAFIITYYYKVFKFNI